jgi:uncharacterized protein YceH (UPF0502 family)
MTRMVTSRVNEVLGLEVASVQKAAQKLNAGDELQDLEADVAELEKSVMELKSTIAGLPFKHSK